MTWRLAIISDVHGDVHALTDALATFEELGCDEVVCGGDLINKGLFPGETIELLQKHRVPCIRGNHDRKAVWLGRSSDRDGTYVGPIHDLSGWDLNPHALRFLSRLQLSWARTIDGVRVALHHGRPGSDKAGVYPDRLSMDEARQLLDEAEADVLIVGHTHIPFRVELQGRGIIVNPGALLRDPATELDEPEFAGLATAAPGTIGVLELLSLRYRAFTAKGTPHPYFARFLPGKVGELRT